VEDLLRIADSGPEIPADGADRIKAAIRPQWRDRVRSRMRKQWVWTGVAAAAVAILAVGLVASGILGSLIPGGTAAVAVVELLQGTVHVYSPTGQLQMLSSVNGVEPLAEGSSIRTGGESRVALRLAGGHSLRLDVGTSVRLASADVAELGRGAIYIDSGEESAPPVEVRTAYGVVREIGTQFEVRSDDESLAVAVRDGAVSILGEGPELEVLRGTAVTIAADGLLQQSRVEASASHWDWVQQVAPPFDIEGRTVTTFMDWVAAETGFRVRYSSSELGEFARRTVLHATVAGLTPVQASEVVLASCGLAADWNSEFVVVRRAGLSPQDQ
jgi:hypothetical protein